MSFYYHAVIRHSIKSMLCCVWLFGLVGLVNVIIFFFFYFLPLVCSFVHSFHMMIVAREMTIAFERIAINYVVIYGMSYVCLEYQKKKKIKKPDKIKSMLYFLSFVLFSENRQIAKNRIPPKCNHVHRIWKNDKSDRQSFAHCDCLVIRNGAAWYVLVLEWRFAVQFFQMIIIDTKR